MSIERTDSELLLASRADPDAFTELYRRHAEDLLRYFARRTLDPEAAAELTAETFAEAFASRKNLTRIPERTASLGCTGWRGISSDGSSATAGWIGVSPTPGDAGAPAPAGGLRTDRGTWLTSPPSRTHSSRPWKRCPVTNARR